MRISKSLLLSALFTLVLGTVSANTNPENNSAREEIKQLITKSHLVSNIQAETTVNITFIVNEENELIVMSTDDVEVDRAIKSVLNYKKLKSSDMMVNNTYTLPITLKRL